MEIAILPYREEKKLECYTARYKLKEARHWLEEMMKPENFNDDERFGWCLNSFCNAVISAIDYVHADFVFNKIIPRIDWKEFTRTNDNDKNEIIKKHVECKALIKFRGEFKNKKDILLKDPLVNYFYNKRQEIFHIRWSADKWGARSGEEGNWHYSHRGLESMGGWSYIYDKDPNALLPMFDNYIPVKEQKETLELLSDNQMDVRKIGTQLCDKIKDFIDKFEGKDYFS